MNKKRALVYGKFTVMRDGDDKLIVRHNYGRAWMRLDACPFPTLKQRIEELAAKHNI
jgi:hypothetical protein